VAANSGKPGNPGKVMEFCEVWKKSWKSHEKLQKVMEFLEKSWKMARPN